MTELTLEEALKAGEEELERAEDYARLLLDGALKEYHDKKLNPDLGDYKPGGESALSMARYYLRQAGKEEEYKDRFEEVEERIQAGFTVYFKAQPLRDLIEETGRKAGGYGAQLAKEVHERWGRAREALRTLPAYETLDERIPPLLEQLRRDVEKAVRVAPALQAIADYLREENMPPEVEAWLEANPYRKRREEA